MKNEAGSLLRCKSPFESEFLFPQLFFGLLWKKQVTRLLNSVIVFGELFFFSIWSKELK